MNLLLQGIGIGFGFSLLIGPMIFIYLQTGIERGFRAGVSAAFGVWISDVIFIFAIYFGVSYIERLIVWDGFELWLGSIGGIILSIIGLITLNSLPPKPEKDEMLPKKDSSYFSLFSKGFIINSFNPFPIIFWSGVMTSYSKRLVDGFDTFVLFGSILVTIMIMDMIKVLSAKQLKKILTEANIYYIRKVSGIVILVMGIILFIKSWI